MSPGSKLRASAKASAGVPESQVSKSASSDWQYWHPLVVDTVGQCVRRRGHEAVDVDARFLASFARGGLGIAHSFRRPSLRNDPTLRDETSNTLISPSSLIRIGSAATCVVCFFMPPK
jgi:hypothetical protein